MAQSDLSKWVVSDVDFYELLGITFETCSEPELRRAYRKTSLKYHPDKLGKDFDPDKYELFQAAYGILNDPELKAKYDTYRHGRIQKQRANDLFEGKRRQMKEDLEARERGERGGAKRSREDETENEMQRHMKKLAQEGRKRRAARASMLAENTRVEAVSPTSPPKIPTVKENELDDGLESRVEEDEVEKLQRKIQEAELAKAKRKADRKARKSGGVFASAESSPMPPPGMDVHSYSECRVSSTPLKQTNLYGAPISNDSTSTPRKFSFSPSISTPKRKDFTATMERLKAASRSRSEVETSSQKSKASS